MADARRRSLCGGKAAGLARLLHAGFNVPAGICLTAELYRAALSPSGVFARIEELAAHQNGDLGARLAGIRRLIETAPIGVEAIEVIHRGVATLRDGPPGMLAVRSSAVHEDGVASSHAGIHATFIGAYDADAVVESVKRCWASLWTETAWAYRERLRLPHTGAAMAVVVQRFVAGGRGGVVFSVDPLTGDPTTIVVEAAWGAAGDVVSGTRTPDHYRLTTKEGGLTVTVSEPASAHPVLTRPQLLELAQLVQSVERTLGTAADVEWVFDGTRFWILQGRPVVPTGAARSATLWTRANLKEVFPDLPSPLALSYLSVALNQMFHGYHAAQGYELSPDARLVAVFRGRPYLNLTLMQEMATVRGGDPRIVSRLFGGAAPSPSVVASPTAVVGRGLGHIARLARELLTTVFVTPRRARRVFRKIRGQAKTYDAIALDRLDDAALIRHLVQFGAAFLDPAMLRRLHEIVSAQSRAYMILDRLLAAWLPARAEALMTELTTGLGTLPNARLTYGLMALSEVARSEARVATFLSSADDDTLRTYRCALAGTRFADGFEALLREFGHRGPFESDVMSARFGEDPAPLLRFVQIYLRAKTLENPHQHVARREQIQRAARQEVRDALRGARWLLFSIVCSALQRLLAQRDENRHVTTLLVSHLRRVVLEIGGRATQAGVLDARDDIFFVLWEELPSVLRAEADWRSLVRHRRREREHNREVAAPDLVRGGEMAEHVGADGGADTDGDLVGLGVSPGRLRGKLRILRSAADMRTLSGEIVVLAAIEPSLTSLFPVVGGVIAEIGGVLSHAAILAREYGVPAVVNVTDATRRLKDGDYIELDGTTGRVRLLGRLNGHRRGEAAVTKQQ
ncbi:MAG TPA: PEP/pyruvate-binding domain-containing protein [Methylomirabilota bacterium]